MVNALIGAVHLGKAWQFCQLDLYWLQKTLDFPGFFWPGVYGVYGQSCQAILCYKVYSGVASMYYTVCWGCVMGVHVKMCTCKDVLDPDKDGASGPLT